MTELSDLKLVRFGDAVTLEGAHELAGRIESAFDGAVRNCRLVDLDPPPVDRIEAGLLTRVLHQEVGGHVLGITGADLFDSSGEDFWSFLFGGKDSRSHVAVVSTHRLAAEGLELALSRLAKIALHELGHNFGLVHHYELARAEGGGCCPMSKGDFNRHGEVSYLRMVIDSRGYRFCESCRQFLRLAWIRPS